MKSMERKLLIYIPISILVVILIHFYFVEVEGVIIFLMAIGSFLITRGEWKYIKMGIETAQIQGETLQIKRFPIIEKVKKIDLSKLDSIEITEDSIYFAFENKKYWLRQSTLVSGDWVNFSREIIRLKKNLKL